MYELNDREHDAVLRLNAEYRYAHFCDKTATSEGLYILINADGPVLLEEKEADAEGGHLTVLPVWCHERYVNDYLQQCGADIGRPQLVTTAVWNEKWVPQLAAANIQMAIMPIEEDGDFLTCEVFALGAEDATGVFEA